MRQRWRYLFNARLRGMNPTGSCFFHHKALQDPSLIEAKKNHVGPLKNKHELASAARKQPLMS
jgi:hypothetical protein